MRQVFERFQVFASKIIGLLVARKITKNFVIWVLCYFHGDQVINQNVGASKEISSKYVVCLRECLKFAEIITVILSPGKIYIWNSCKIYTAVLPINSSWYC